MGVLINDIHSDSLGIRLLDSYTISAPDVKKHEYDIPYRNGKLDVTEALNGQIYYQNRTIVMEFVKEEFSLLSWHVTYSRIANHFHGIKVKLIFDNDEKYYWEGRALVEASHEESYSLIRISVDVFPYKKSLSSSLGDWLWDPFNFETDIARNYKNLKVTGSLSVHVIGTEIPVIPLIHVSSAMELKFNGKTFNLVAGQNKIYDLQIIKGEQDLLFLGNGVVSIEFNEGSL